MRGFAGLQRCAAALLRSMALSACVMLFAVPAQAQPADPAQRAATVIVLDGSNSMNARLPGDKNFKFVSVREALRVSLPAVSGTEVGLAAFGARRASDCNDAEVIAPPATNVAPVIAALERFQPRGFSPVVLALRAAAKALPAGVAKPSIVLVLDDLASCRTEDPCAVASQLKRDIPALAIHVVVLGPRPVDLPVLACMVKQTGGQLFQVADGPGIGPALQEALTVAGLDRREPPRPVPAERSTIMRPVATPRPATPGLGIDVTKPGLHLTARLADGSQPLQLPVLWRIWRADTARAADPATTVQQGEPEPIVTVIAPALSRPLANGRYEVEARSGMVASRRSIEITSQGPTPVVIDLNAALLAIKAPMAKGGQGSADTTLTVLALGPPATPIWLGRVSAHDLLVPPGSYRVRATAGTVTAERVLTVGQGVTGDVEISLDVGRLLIEEQSDASAAKGGPPQLIVETDEQDSTGARREVYRAHAPRLDLTLPAGSYMVTARRESTELRVRLQIRPGETVSRQFAIPLARIRLVSKLGNILPVHYKIERMDLPAQPIQRWGDAEAVFDLPVGRYRLEVRVGEQNSVAVRELDIRSTGGEQRVDIDTGAGGIQLKLKSGSGGLGLGEVYWQIFNDRDEPVWRTSQAEPKTALSQGRYRARAEVRDRVLERTFEVRAGDNRVIEVGE